MSCVLGVDPGLSGALAFLRKDGRLLVCDVPTFEVKRGKRKKRELNQHGLQEILSKFGSGVVVAYVEVASARPGQGTHGGNARRAPVARRAGARAANPRGRARSSHRGHHM